MHGMQTLLTQVHRVCVICNLPQETKRKESERWGPISGQPLDDKTCIANPNKNHCTHTYICVLESSRVSREPKSMPKGEPSPTAHLMVGIIISHSISKTQCIDPSHVLLIIPTSWSDFVTWISTNSIFK